MELCMKLCFLFTVIHAREFSAKEYAKLPRLFDLDNYHECMAQDDGLYCLGTFHLKPVDENDPVYHLMEEYSSNKFAFNRTLMHRGWCVSQRCARAPNATRRFERCAETWARHRGLHSTLHKLNYCRSATNLNLPQNPDTAQRVFIYVVLGILVLNIIGTVCDTLNGKKEGITRVMALWSIPSNWKILTTTIYEQKDPRLSSLAPLQGARVIVLALVMLAHTQFLHIMVYLQNPQDIEKDAAGRVGTFLSNGTTSVQIFVIFSSFLCAYNLLLYSEKKPLLLSSIAKQILKRAFRIAPVHLLLVGFGATWYAYTRNGPLWPALVENERDACRDKFWTHALFINNFVEPKKKCYLQTWFLAVDMQLYIVSLFLTLFLSKLGSAKWKILFILYFSSLFSLIVIAYFNGWQSMVYISVPETVHAYYDSPSFERLYINPFGHISSCLIGLSLAHAQHYVDVHGVKVHQWKWLRYIHGFFIPLYIYWLLSGAYIRDTFSTPIAMAAFCGIERFVFNVLLITIIFGTINIDTPLSRLFGWRGWDFFARLSLPAVMIHWAVNMTFAASRPMVIYSTFLDIVVDATATWLITYTLAVPVSILVEIPAQRFLDYILLHF